MGQLWGAQPHTLAQFARRAKISEGRARALYTAHGLPRPNGFDADGRPLWWATTIDAWCASTDRTVADESLWIFRVRPAPAAELQRGVITVNRHGRPHPMYAIVWDTEHGHVIYLVSLADTGDHLDWMAVHAAELIEPRWWSTAVVVMPLDEDLGGLHDEPFAYVYRLTTGKQDDPAEVESPFSGLRRLFGRTIALMTPAGPRATWEGQLELAAIAKVVGTSIPVWVQGTRTVKNAELTLVYNRTSTTPDDTTGWPAVQARLAQAVGSSMASNYPAAFAALAVDTADQLASLRAAHAKSPDTGPGWYLVARPAVPAPPVELEQHITGAALVEDLDLVANELVELRVVEAALDIDDPRGEPYSEAIRLLTWQLRKHKPAVANAGLVTYIAPWQGPVVDAWRDTLTQVEDLAAVLRLRRANRLLGESTSDIVREAYRDAAGRYVLVVQYTSDTYFLAEWPQSLDGVATWTDKTVLAADDSGSTVTLLALTPTAEGRMRIDPVPLPPCSDREAFAYGYGGGTPTTTYQALLRCALGEHTTVRLLSVLQSRSAVDNTEPVSQLWHAISTTKGPLRLSWPQVQLWARADRRLATTGLTDTAN
jgi:hypothetical protein